VLKKEFCLFCSILKTKEELEKVCHGLFEKVCYYKKDDVYNVGWKFRFVVDVVLPTVNKTSKKKRCHIWRFLCVCVCTRDWIYKRAFNHTLCSSPCHSEMEAQLNHFFEPLNSSQNMTSALFRYVDLPVVKDENHVTDAPVHAMSRGHNQCISGGRL